MKYRIETWKVSRLLDRYNSEKLDLNPSYQRRFIWSIKDQQTLIDSINRGYAIPNVFLFEKEKDNYEMVDGQQRTRTILGFVNKQFKTIEGSLYSEELFESFLDYKLAIIIIEEIGDDLKIEDFYALVNKSGIHLNRPELKKAEYFETLFLKLITSISESEKFTNLQLFTETTSKRMVDVDYVSELVTLLKFGNTDKKNKVDKIFEEDITQAEYDILLVKFNEILDILSLINEKTKIKSTRYKQRNDFYTLFGFIAESETKEELSFIYFYDLLVLFNDHITPSNDKCKTFQDYTFHCISQSNSKSARDARLNTFRQIFLNTKKTPNKSQKDILKYFNVEASSFSLKAIGGFYTIDIDKL
jgi:hypothetical protein